MQDGAVAFIHATTMTPTKVELLTAWLPQQDWYRGRGIPQLTRVGGFRLDDPDGEVGIELQLVRDDAPGGPVVYHVPMTYRGHPLPASEAALIGTAEHGVLGPRWVYDAAYDPVALRQIAALLSGEVVPQHQNKSDTPDSTVHVSNPRPPGTDVRFRIVRIPEPGCITSGVLAEWKAADGATVRGGVITLM
jgi:hypothetical protein